MDRPAARREMHPPPEMIYETVAPHEIMRRLELVHERYRQRLLTAAQFNESLKLFQFEDEVGHTWSPGVQSGQWYRWDMDRWTAAEPPARLRVPQGPVLFNDFERRVEAAPSPRARPIPVTCRTCGATNVGKKFCTQCGSKL